MTIEITPETITMLVIDIDGTLLNPSGEITPATRAAVQAARQAGIVVTLATARRYCNTAPIAIELGLDIPLILYDGALIVEHPQGKILHTHPLAATVGQQAVDLLASNGIQPIVHPATGTAEEIWTGPAELDNLWVEAYFTTFPEQMRRMPYANLCHGHPDPLRVVGFADEERIMGLLPAVSALDCSWIVTKRGNYGSAEIALMDPGCSKASGVKALAEHFDIALEQVMAIGDNTNDIQMLRSAGWGVAMGHAPEEVQAVARAITTSNSEDGVALAIERYALCRSTITFSNSRKRTI
ncbi:MAG TPA: Cof-type HAD-IIB family hydrolase [Ktedonobacteraceae bacterium]|nr:Cof-type HAD-IIB family hydrolase [Ktedonobacteraceae bacterium]